MIKFKHLFLLSILFFGLNFNGASAASISLISNSQNLGINQEFNVDLIIESDVNINAAQGIVSFSPGVLQLISVSRDNSIFNFWVEDPTISNDVGTMSFTGGTAQGVSGKSLKVLSMKFKATGVGESAIKLSGGTVAADDGQGTNVLSDIKEAKVSVTGMVTEPVLVEAPKVIVRIPIPSGKLPSLPELEISLYPDSSKWYKQIGDVVMFWNVPQDIISVASLVNKNPNSIPTVFDKELLNGKNLGSLAEGIWYAHARFKNNIGNGPVAHHRIAIDVTPPLPFNIEVNEGIKTDNPSPVLNFGTQDSLSGIDFYSVIVGNQAPIKSESGELKLPIQEPGDYTVLVKAFDKAGNSSEDSINITILPIESPEIKFVTQPYYSDSDNVLLVQGSALPERLILLAIIRKSDGVAAARATARADESGQWEYSFSESFKNGKYEVVAQAQDDRGALSLPVKSSQISIKSKPILKLGFLELNLWGVIILLLVILVGGFSGGIWYWKLRQEKLSRRVFITKQDLAKVSALLKSDLKKIKAAIKTPGEFDDDFIIKSLEENVEKIDKYIQKEVGNVTRK
ncbi:MAG: cohesin domain-containing protein [Candidatus Pacebacteria bacterium]|nr:cohesin domain-containing protein [Candidatus Paceibacterota bacterium]